MKFPDQNIVGRASSSQIMKSDDWARAKTESDFRASSRIIGQLWSDKKTYQLKQTFSDPGKVVFISQPTTTGTNVLARQFAEKLSRDFKTDFIFGDDFAISMHMEQSKKISFTARAFHPREYELVDIKELKQFTNCREVCLVEDVITSGGSVASFIKALSREGIEVKSIAALTGEKRLNIDEKTQKRLGQAIKAKNIDIDLKTLTNSLTRTEAGGIIMLANTAKTDAAIKELQDQLEGRIQYEKDKDLQQERDRAPEEAKPAQVQETIERYQINEKETPKEMESKQLGPDYTHHQLKPEIEATEKDIVDLNADLKVPQLDTEYAKGWNKELDDNQKLVDQEHSIEMPRGQEKLQKESRQPENQEKALDREPQFELGR